MSTAAVLHDTNSIHDHDHGDEGAALDQTSISDSATVSPADSPLPVKEVEQEEQRQTIEAIGDMAAELKEHDVVQEEIEQAEKIKEELTTELEANNGWLQILGNDQLMKKIIKEGVSNKRPLRGEVCTINFKGCLAEDESVVFQPEETFTFQLGDAEVISGLDLAIPLMSQNEVSTISIAPRFAFGSKGLPPLVPADAWLLYTVELIQFEQEKELHDLSPSERRKIGNRKRERGNWWYSRDEHSSAVQCYRRALEFLDEVDAGIGLPADEDVQDKEFVEEMKLLMEDRLKAYNNMAAAQLKMQAYGPALKSVEAVLKCQPFNVKALYRKGMILSAKGDTKEAIQVFQEVLALEPGNTAVSQELKKITVKRKQERLSEQILYKRMFNTEPDGKKSTEDSKGSQFKHTFNLALLVGGVIVAVAGVMAYRYVNVS